MEARPDHNPCLSFCYFYLLLFFFSGHYIEIRPINRSYSLLFIHQLVDGVHCTWGDARGFELLITDHSVSEKRQGIQRFYPYIWNNDDFSTEVCFDWAQTIYLQIMDYKTTILPLYLEQKLFQYTGFLSLGTNSLPSNNEQMTIYPKDVFL